MSNRQREKGCGQSYYYGASSVTILFATALSSRVAAGRGWKLTAWRHRHSAPSAAREPEAGTSSHRIAEIIEPPRFAMSMV